MAGLVRAGIGRPMPTPISRPPWDRRWRPQGDGRALHSRLGRRLPGPGPSRSSSAWLGQAIDAEPGSLLGINPTWRRSCYALESTPSRRCPLQQARLRHGEPRSARSGGASTAASWRQTVLPEAAAAGHVLAVGAANRAGDQPHTVLLAFETQSLSAARAGRDSVWLLGDQMSGSRADNAL